MSGSFSTWRSCCTRRRPSCALCSSTCGPPCSRLIARARSNASKRTATSTSCTSCSTRPPPPRPPPPRRRNPAPTTTPPPSPPPPPPLARPARRRRRPRRSLPSGTVPASAAAAASAVIAVDRRGSAFDRGERDSGGGRGHETVGSKATAPRPLRSLRRPPRRAGACFEAGLLPHCAHAMHDDEPVMQCWAALCLAKLVQTNASIATAALAPRLRLAPGDPHRPSVVEVRAAAVHLQGEIVRALGGVDADASAAPAAAPSAAAGRRRAGGGGGGGDRFVGGRASAPPHVLAPRCARRRLTSGTRGAPRRNLVAAPRATGALRRYQARLGAADAHRRAPRRRRLRHTPLASPRGRVPPLSPRPTEAARRRRRRLWLRGRRLRGLVGGTVG